MALRKASSYSRRIARPFTRNSRSKGKAYIKTVPGIKIAKYNNGNQKAFDAGKHPFSIKLVAEERVQMRDNALEAARMFIVKKLTENSPDQFYFVVKVHPHHMQRENKSAGGMAGADRISTGMSQAFGRIISRAALVKSGQEIFFISCADEKTARLARKTLQDIKSKLPGRSRILFNMK